MKIIPTYSDPLFDEENALTHLADLWEDYFFDAQDIDERPSHQADGAMRRKELSRMVAQMIDQELTENEADIIRAFYGIGQERESLDELGTRYGGNHRAGELLQAALEKIRYSDAVLQIWKYMYR